MSQNNPTHSPVTKVGTASHDHDTYRPVRHLNQVELARRWSISPRTLERWRWIGEGPAYLKIGGRVVYRVDDIERYEAEHLRGEASDSAAESAR